MLRHSLGDTGAPTSGRISPKRPLVEYFTLDSQTHGHSCGTITNDTDYPAKKRANIVREECVPDEILVYIFHFLDLHSLLSVSQVSRRWNNIARDSFLWQNATFTCFQPISVHVETLQPSASIVHVPKSPSTTPDHAFILRAKALMYDRLKRNVTIWHIRTCFPHVHFWVDWRLPSAQFLRYAADRLVHIEELNLMRSGELVTGHIVYDLATRLRRLKRVNLSQCYMVGDASLEQLLETCGERLEELRLSRCFGLSGALLGKIATKCPKLKVLDLGDGCGCVQDQSLNTLLEIKEKPTPLSRSIEEISLSGADFISEQHLTPFLVKLVTLPKLKRVNLQRTFALTTEGLDRLFPVIHESPVENDLETKSCYMDVRGCTQLMTRHVDEMKERARIYYKVLLTVDHDCILHDDSEASIRNYLRMMVESDIRQ